MLWEAATAGGQTLGEVKPSWPVGGRNAAGETLPGASRGWTPIAWAAAGAGQGVTPRKREEWPFLGLELPGRRRLPDTWLVLHGRASPWRGKRTVLPELTVLMFHILTGRTPPGDP